jgi:hemerythrin superfamily protein
MELLMPDTPTNKRLDRIEEKLDQMSEVLISLARFEEKMDAYNEYRERSWDRMNKFSEKLDKIEKMCDDNARTVHTINKLFWVAIVAIGSAIAAQVLM